MSDQLYVVRRNEKLLEQAKSVFGDLVVDAWFATEKGGSHAADETDLFGWDEQYAITSAVDELTFQTCSIVLKFSNQRRIMFSTTEWATLIPVDHCLIDENHVPC